MVDFRDRVDKILNAATRNFGEDVVWMPTNGGRYVIKGIFDHEYEAIDPDTEQVISSQIPALGVNLHSLNGRVKEGDRFKIRNLNYKAYEIREDGQGGATVFLHKEDHVKRIRKKKDQS